MALHKSHCKHVKFLNDIRFPASGFRHLSSGLPSLKL